MSIPIKRILPVVLVLLAATVSLLVYYRYMQTRERHVRSHYQALIAEAAAYTRDAFDVASKAGLKSPANETVDSLRIDLAKDLVTASRSSTTDTTRTDTTLFLNLLSTIHHWTGPNRFRAVLIAGPSEDIVATTGPATFIDRLPELIAEAKVDSSHKGSFAGVEQELFVHHVNLPAEIGSARVVGDTKWTMVGLVQSTELRAKEKALPPMLLLVIAGGMAVILLSFPFAKIMLLGPSGRVTKHDVFVLSTGLVIASAVVTFGTLEVLSYHWLRMELDERLTETAAAINESFGREAAEIDEQLRHLSALRREGMAVGTVTYGDATWHIGPLPLSQWRVFGSVARTGPLFAPLSAAVESVLGSIERRTGRILGQSREAGAKIDSVQKDSLRSFTSDLRDALAELTPPSENIDHLLDIVDGDTLPLDFRIRRNVLSAHPFFKMAYWIDADGRQKEKWTVRNTNTRTIDVSDRRYFKEARMGHLLSTMNSTDKDPLAYPGWYVESIRSWNEGLVYAVMSQRLRPAVNDSLLVAAVLTPMLSSIRPVMPPDVSFAIIDELGLVQFHTNEVSNLRENLFEAMDSSNELRASAVARTSAWMTTRYRGGTSRVHIAPLENTRWSVVVLADRDPIFIARGGILRYGLMVYLGYLFALALAFRLVHWAIRRGPFSTGFLFWPQRSGVDYISAFLREVAISIGMLFLLFSRSPAALASGSAALALCALVLYYRHLTPGSFSKDINDDQTYEHRTKATGWAPVPSTFLGLLILVFFVVAFLTGPLHSFMSFLVAAALVVLLPKVPERWSQWTSDENRSSWLSKVLRLVVRSPSSGPDAASRYHRRSVLTLIAVLGVLPLCAFYCAVHNEVAVVSAKRAQLVLADSLSSRAERHIQRYHDVTVDSLHRGFLESRLLPANTRRNSLMGLNRSLDVHVPESWFVVRESRRMVPGSDAVQSRQRIIDFFGDFPTPLDLLETGLASPDQGMHAYSHTAADDESRRWLRAGNSPYSLQLTVDAYRYSTRLGRPLPDDDEVGPADVELVLTSRVLDFTYLAGSAKARVLLVTVALLMFGSLYVVVKLMITRVFLTEVLEEKWHGDVPDNDQAPEASKGKLELQLGNVPCKGDASTYTVDTAPGSRPFPNAKSARKILRANATICLSNFEAGLERPELAARKLELLETLVDEYDRRDKGGDKRARILVRSLIYPQAYLEQRALLGMRIVQVGTPSAEDAAKTKAANKDGREAEAVHPIDANLPRWHAVLGRLSISKGDPDNDRGVEESPRLMWLWSLCSDEEKLILYRIVTDGFVSWTSRFTVRTLIYRGLVVHRPALEAAGRTPDEIRPLDVMNDAFRKLVLEAVSPGVYRKLEASESAGLWKRLRVPAMVALALVFAFLLIAQPGAYESAQMLIATVAAGVTVVVKLATLLFDWKSEPLGG